MQPCTIAALLLKAVVNFCMLIMKTKFLVLFSLACRISMYFWFEERVDDVDGSRCWGASESNAMVVRNRIQMWTNFDYVHAAWLGSLWVLKPYTVTVRISPSVFSFLRRVCKESKNSELLTRLNQLFCKDVTALGLLSTFPYVASLHTIASRDDNNIFSIWGFGWNSFTRRSR